VRQRASLICLAVSNNTRIASNALSVGTDYWFFRIPARLTVSFTPIMRVAQSDRVRPPHKVSLQGPRASTPLRIYASTHSARPCRAGGHGHAKHTHIYVIKVDSDRTQPGSCSNQQRISSNGMALMRSMERAGAAAAVAARSCARHAVRHIVQRKQVRVRHGWCGGWIGKQTGQGRTPVCMRRTARPVSTRAHRRRTARPPACAYCQ
jgi:hypothetical protein